MRIGTPQVRLPFPSLRAIARDPRSRSGNSPKSGRRTPHLPPVAWILCLLPLVAVLLEEGIVLTWLFGSLSGMVSKLLRLALWGWAAFVIAQKLAAKRPWPASNVCLYALGIIIPATYLLTGSSFRYIVSESMFIPLTIVTLSVAVRPENRRALIIGLCAIVVVHVCFIFLPPESFVQQKAQWALARRSYAFSFLGDEQAGSKLTGLYQYPTSSGVVCIIGIHLLRFSRLLPLIQFPLIVGCALGCLLTVTRSVYVGLAASILLPFLFGSGRLPRISARVITRLVIGGIVLISAGITAWYLMPASLRTGVQQRFSSENLAKGTEQRLHSSWGMISGLQAMFVSPVWGSSVPNSVQCLGADGQELAPHNSVIYVGLKHGLPAMLLFGATIGLALHGLARFSKLSKGTPENQAFVALLCGFIGCLPILLLNPQYGPLLFWIAAGVGLSYGDYKAAAPRAHRIAYSNSQVPGTRLSPLLGAAGKFQPAISLRKPGRVQFVVHARRRV